MVRGLEIFRQHFKDFTDNYIIIGGTACDIIIDNIGILASIFLIISLT